MRITATQIAQWAYTRDAQGTLPTLVRRLISATSETTALVMPGGDSVGSPGYDGVVQVSRGNAWVPVGLTRWEAGCNKDPITKARSDFKRRSEASTKESVANTTFVFVSPRRWQRKQEWVNEAKGAKHWSDVKALDADDLEAWLETAPAVNMWFAELLGLTGSGVSSVERYWETWRNQSSPALNAAAIFFQRDAAISAFRNALSEAKPFVVVEADSREEAIAFTCAQLLDMGQADNAVCITSPEGWRYVDTNAQLRIALATTVEIAAMRAPAAGSKLIIPMSLGDRPAYPHGRGSDEDDAPRIELPRLSAQDFEAALVNLGVESSDASRLTSAVGRSWSVYRRVRATNPAISRPTWMTDPAARSLVALTLVGCWNGDKAGDRACLEAVFDGTYAQLEAQLRHIASVNDSPVLQIGTIWKAKAPLELLYLFASKITSTELQSFFKLAEAVLSTPDPSLELETDKRWAAAIYGKTRQESGLVINSIVDSLIKLRVYAEEHRSDPNAELIMSSVDSLVRNLLRDADAQRWLSLSSVLRELAEASPDVFLDALERSLNSNDTPVLSLLTETDSSGSFGKAWHTDLLRALEVLAWYPARLPRVAEILCRLVSTPIKGNWGNTPRNTLISLFRPWWPQTTATAEQRLASIDRLLRIHNRVAWDLLSSVIGSHGFATENAAPRWRDDNAGAPSPNDGTDFGWYASEIGARLLKHAEDYPDRIANLTDHIDRFAGTYQIRLAELVEQSIKFDDDSRELVRASLRKHLNWQNSFNRDGTKGNRKMADRLRPAFDVLAASDIVKRHAWLFKNHWVELPDGKEDDYQRADEARSRFRAEGIHCIFDENGWDGLKSLALVADDKWLVGREIAKFASKRPEYLPWIVEQFLERETSNLQLLVGGALRQMQDDERVAFLKAIVDGYASRIGEPTDIAALFVTAPCDRKTWDFVETLDAGVKAAYWESVNPGFVVDDDSADRMHLVNRLLQAKRHRTAFRVLEHNFKGVDAVLLANILDEVRKGSEPNGPIANYWNVGQAFTHLDNSGQLARRDLATLEFAYFLALEHTEHGARNLYAELLSDPHFFMELICLVYKPRSGTPEPVDESLKPAAELAWRVLHDGRGLPGASEDGAFDVAAFSHWVEKTRELAEVHDRAECVDSVLGQWFSKCPADENGIWPCGAVRDLLDESGAENLRSGFSTGIFNNRGMTTRAYYDGGTQERTLSQKYRALAEPLRVTHPNVAAVFDRLADSYDRHASYEDRSAQLRVEGR
jgi:hypothetical protein